MIVHIHTQKNLPSTYNAFVAMKGFAMLGCDINFYETDQELHSKLNKDDLVVGYISNVIYALDHLGIKRPEISIIQRN